MAITKWLGLPPITPFIHYANTQLPKLNSTVSQIVIPILSQIFRDPIGSLALGLLTWIAFPKEHKSISTLGLLPIAIILSNKVHQLAGPLLIALYGTCLILRTNAYYRANDVALGMKIKGVEREKVKRLRAQNRSEQMPAQQINLNHAHKLADFLFLGNEMKNTNPHDYPIHDEGKIYTISKFDLAIRFAPSYLPDFRARLPKAEDEVNLDGRNLFVPKNLTFKRYGENPHTILYWENKFIEDLASVVQKIDRARSKHQNVIIHDTQLEENKSSAIAALYIALKYGVSVVQAALYIATVRPESTPLGSFFPFLVEFRLTAIRKKCAEMGCFFPEPDSRFQYSREDLCKLIECPLDQDGYARGSLAEEGRDLLDHYYPQSSVG